MNKVLMGFVDGRAVWYKPFDNIMYCQSLNLLYTAIQNFADACEKCKVFKNFEYATNAEGNYAKIINKMEV
jgi:hypothetical protein